MSVRAAPVVPSAHVVSSAIPPHLQLIQMGVAIWQARAIYAAAELGLADPKWSDDELIDFMLAHPILIQRPIVVTPRGVRVCRPSELVLDLLDNPVQSFVKEDGEAVTRAKP